MNSAARSPSTRRVPRWARRARSRTGSAPVVLGGPARAAAGVAAFCCPAVSRRWQWVDNASRTSGFAGDSDPGRRWSSPWRRAAGPPAPRRRPRCAPGAAGRCSQTSPLRLQIRCAAACDVRAFVQRGGAVAAGVGVERASPSDGARSRCCRSGLGGLLRGAQPYTVRARISAPEHGFARAAPAHRLARHVVGATVPRFFGARADPPAASRFSCQLAHTSSTHPGPLLRGPGGSRKVTGTASVRPRRAQVVAAAHASAFGFDPTRPDAAPRPRRRPPRPREQQQPEGHHSRRSLVHPYRHFDPRFPERSRHRRRRERTIGHPSGPALPLIRLRVSKLGVQRALGLPECATPPEEVYALAKRRGMDFVTITDHDTIDGVLAIADRPDVFVSEELTAALPRRAAGRARAVPRASRPTTTSGCRRTPATSRSSPRTCTSTRSPARSRTRSTPSTRR